MIVVLTTFPSAEIASKIASHLVETKLAACVNLITGVRSIYAWKGELCEDAEVLAIVKTTDERLESVRAAIVSQHPYECPEVVALDVAGGHQPYLDWVMAMSTEVN